MTSITFLAGTLPVHEAVLNDFLKNRPEVKKVIVGTNFQGLQQSGVPHGTQIRIDDNATLTASLLPEDQGSCVAMFKIKNFDEIEHSKRLQNPSLNDKFLAKLGKGPSFDNTYCDALLFDLGREKSDWKPYLGPGTIGVVAENGTDEWSKRHFVVAALPNLPLATDACIAISGRSFKDFASHHYISKVLPPLIQRNVRKLAAAYAEVFNLELVQSDDNLCHASESKQLPTPLACCYDPVVHIKDSEHYIGSKLLKSVNSTNILLISPQAGLETNETLHPADVPFGVPHSDRQKVALSDKVEAYYAKCTHWEGKTTEMHPKIKSRFYKIDAAQTFYANNPRTENRKSYRWIAMVLGKK